MERKTLEEMGLDKDQVNTIMAEFGKKRERIKGTSRHFNR